MTKSRAYCLIFSDFGTSTPYLYTQHLSTKVVWIPRLEKYENAIKLLWANKYEKAEEELLQLKKLNPEDLMPNIQYWLGEVYYANKNFQQAVIEFGAGFANFPDSIKGPDNLLKLGLSFSNLNQKKEACSAFYELEVKYNNSPKNVLERSKEERKKLNCPEE